jgi:hypothetical protein
VIRRFVTIALLALTAAAAAAEPVVVKNGAEPAHGVRQMRLEEVWRVGGADDDENFFGLVTWAERGPDGLLYVLDVQLSQVNVYDDDGTLVRTLFHEGDGPGEIRRPRDLVILPDGSVGAVQEFPGKIVRVDAENIPLDSIEPRMGEAADGGFVALTTAEHRGGTFMVAGVQIKPGERQGTQQRHMYLATVDDAGHIGQPLLERHVDWDFTNFTYDENINLASYFWANAVGPEGRVYAAPEREAYRINVYAPDGTLERVVEREYTSRKRTDEDMAWLRSLLEGAFSQVPFDVELKLSDHDSDINWLSRGLQVDEQGRMWILPSRGNRDQPAGVLATFDVFDKGGVFDHQVQVMAPGDGTKDGVFLLGDDRVLVIKGYVDATATMFGGAPAGDEDEAEPMELICYRVAG